MGEDIVQTLLKERIVCRRSAQIALGDVWNEDFKNAKVDLFSSITKEKASEVYEFLESIGIDGNDLYQWAEAKSNDWLRGSGLVDYRFLEEAVSTVKDIKPEYVEAFKALADKLDPKFRYRTTRVLSNNSVMLWEKPSKEELAKIFEPIKTSGEPGFIFAENAAKRRADFKGVNPCGEILLTSEKGAGSTCNLTEVVISKFVREDGSFDLQEAKKAIRLATRMGSRITNVNLFDEGWDRIQKRDRLLGVSITGVQDAWDAMAIEPDSEMASTILNELGKEARREADKYHEYMGIPKSLLVTCTKPSGTLSQLPGVSSGGHASYAPYYIRRIRITRKDPIVDALLDLGYTCTPENGQGEDINHPDCNTVVFSFPVKTNAKIRAIDEPAVKQLQRYKTLMDNYIEHNGSITVTVDWPEWDGVIDWVYDNWESCVGVAFLARFDPSLPGNQYPQMPYEVCTEEYYNNNRVEPPSEDELISFIMSHEIQYEEFDLLEAGCSTGACPVK